MVARGEPVQEFYSIGEVCALTELKPHVLRYWESQFKLLNPAKNRSGNRVYARREVELILLVKHLLYTEKYTIDGARQKLDEHRKGGVIARRWRGPPSKCRRSNRWSANWPSCRRSSMNATAPRATDPTPTDR